MRTVESESGRKEAPGAGGMKSGRRPGTSVVIRGRTFQAEEDAAHPGGRGSQRGMRWTEGSVSWGINKGGERRSIMGRLSGSQWEGQTDMARADKCAYGSFLPMRLEKQLGGAEKGMDTQVPVSTDVTTIQLIKNIGERSEHGGWLDWETIR